MTEKQGKSLLILLNYYLTLYKYLIRGKFEKHDLSSLKHVTTAGEALNPEILNVFREKTGLTIMEGFGQTESTLILANLVGDVESLLASL